MSMTEAFDQMEETLKTSLPGGVPWRLRADLDELRRKIEAAERQKADRSKEQVGLGVDG
jgi:hypothetical protein